MRLSELDPKWIQPISFAVQVPTGVSFLCPHCQKLRLAVNFKQPIDPEGWLKNTNWRAIEPAWDRAGETFGDLTLSPSVDFAEHGHWHGHIQNGIISFS